jgi:hypothetical protein
MTIQNSTTKPRERSASALALNQARKSPGTLLSPSDVKGTTPTAASKAFSRLAEKGVLKRAAKGLYYAPKATLLGPSQPSQLAILQKKTAHNSRPTGATAANLLGVSNQVPARAELVLYASAKPKHASAASVTLRKSQGANAAKPIDLNPTDAALLEFLRDRGSRSELEPTATINRLRQVLLHEHKAELAKLKPPMQLTGLVFDAMTEPPRVRAMLGALLQWCEVPDALYRQLRDSLNPLTRFDFGLFRALPTAKEWQAK